MDFRFFVARLSSSGEIGYGQEMKSPAANIVDPLEKKPWGITQFTVAALDGNLFYIHRS